MEFRCFKNSIYEKLGAHPVKIDGVSGVYFAVWAPNAIRVSVVGNFNNWDGRAYQMNLLESGIYELFIPGVRAGDIYKYEIKARGGLTYLKSDPYANAAQLRPNNASVVFDLGKYAWQDENWMKKRGVTQGDKAPISVYEVHLGSWKKPDDGREFYNYREIAPMLASYVNYVETINGQEKNKNDDEAGTSVVIGKDALAPGLDDQMIGLKPGTEKKITITYPDDYSDTTVAGMEAVFDIKINYIKITTTPEYTDDLVKSATDGKYTTTEDYTKYLTDELQKDTDKTADSTDRANVLKAIKEKTTFNQYPEGEIDSYVKSVMDNIESSASQYGIGVPTFLQYFYGYTDESAFVSYLQSTVESVMQEKIVVSSIALEKNLIANDKETDAYKQKLMDDNEVDEDTINSKYSASDLKFYATEEKVLDYLMGTAVQVESTEASSEDASEDGSTEAERTESTTEAASEAE